MNSTQDTINYRKVSHRGNIELVHAHYKRHQFAPHTHNTYSIGIVQQGQMGFDHQRGCYKVPTGSMSIINPNEMHSGYPAIDEGWECRMFYLAPTLFQEVTEEPCGLPYFPVPVISDPTVVQLLLKTHIILQQSPEPLERETILLDALAILTRQFSSRQHHQKPIGRYRPVVQEVCEVIQRCYAKPLSLKNLAAVANLSRYHFLRVFRQETGLSPHTYLLQVRTERAKQKLATGLPISEVALACGFCDQSHLTRRFKKVYGFTPGQFVRHC